MSDTSKLRRATDDEKVAMVAAYDGGMTVRQVADKWGFAASSVNRYIRKAHGKTPSKVRREQREEEFALTGGRWVRDGLVQRWKWAA